MRLATLMKRLRAVGGEGKETRAELVEELIQEGYHPEEIEWAFSKISSIRTEFEGENVLGSFRFFEEEEAKQLSKRAQAKLLRLQSRGLIDVFQMEAILNLVRKSAPRRIGTRALREIIEYVCEGGEELNKLDGKLGRFHLN